MKKYILYLNSEEVREMKEALRDKAYIFTRARGTTAPDIWERANIIDDILNKIYANEEDAD